MPTPSLFAESNAGLEAGQQAMASLLAASNVPTLDYRAFERNGVQFIDKLGDHDVSNWVSPLARGVTPALFAEVSAKGRNTTEAGIQEAAGNIFSAMSGAARGSAVRSYGQVVSRVGAGIGLPPSLTGALIQGTQKTVVDGLGSVGASLLAKAGLGVLGGPAGIIAGGLLSMALGAFFGDEKAKPKPPPAEKKRTLSRPSVSDVPHLDTVFEEILTAAIRWRKTMPTAKGVINPFLVPSSYAPSTRRTPNLSGTFSSDDVVHGRTPYVYNTVEAQWLGVPVEWAPNTQAVGSYVFNHDCLARWVGYNLNLSMATQEILKKDFSDQVVERRYPSLKLWAPYFADIGWAEYIVAGYLGSLWTHAGTGWDPVGLNPIRRTSGGGYTDRGNDASWFHPSTYDLMQTIKGSLHGSSLGTDSLLRLVAGEPLKTPRQALAHVTVLLRGSMAVAANMAIQEEYTRAETNRVTLEIQTWRDEKLSLIGATTNDPQVRNNVEDRRNQDARERQRLKIARKSRPRWLLPAVGVAAVGLAGGAYWALRRH